MELTGKRVVITGGGRGLGRAMALALARAGAAVAVVARTADELVETVWLIEEQGGQALAIPADVRDAAQVYGMVAQVQEQLGSITTVINSAGVGLRAPIHETSEAQWDDVLDSLLKASYLVSAAVIPAMIAQGGGNIINVGAPLDRIAAPGFAAYYAAKSGVDGLTRVMAKDLRRYGINVNQLHPGGFADTRMVRQTVPDLRGPLLDPAEIGALAVVLAAEPPRGRTGQTFDAHQWRSVTA
ncbi:MAG: SDR family NAD(P)-dependent oxidoreductase [Oscillochloridaceae bacterium umkhey_bin13]